MGIIPYCWGKTDELVLIWHPKYSPILSYHQHTSFIFILFIFSWRLISLQYGVGFCFRHRDTCVLSPLNLLAAFPIPPSRPSQRARFEPWVIQQTPTDNPNHAWQYVCFSATIILYLLKWLDVYQIISFGFILTFSYPKIHKFLSN